jgi:hypothetical protein
MTDKLELEITSLRWDERLGSKSDVPYIIVNCTFKVDPGSDIWQSAK